LASIQAGGGDSGLLAEVIGLFLEDGPRLLAAVKDRFQRWIAWYRHFARRIGGVCRLAPV
jgi:hypothetical protein